MVLLPRFQALTLIDVFENRQAYGSGTWPHGSSISISPGLCVEKGSLMVEPVTLGNFLILLWDLLTIGKRETRAVQSLEAAQTPAAQARVRGSSARCFVVFSASEDA